ncbi:signal peptidase II [candidate division KSB1 bacterium]
MRIIIVSFIVLILDQATKLIAKTNIRLGDSVSVIGDFFRFTHIENRGMAFGIEVSNHFLFNLFSIIAALAILYYLIAMRNQHIVPRFALAMIFGGAMGNLYDRILLGKVVDFFDFDFPNINIPSFNLYFFDTPRIYLERWPIFNIADVAVSIGMMILIVTIFIHDKPFLSIIPGEEEQTSEEEEEEIGSTAEKAESQ